MASINRISERVLSPTPEQIEAECRLIQDYWTPELRKKREFHYRIDSASRQARVQIRFLKFLAEISEPNF